MAEEVCVSSFAGRAQAALGQAASQPPDGRLSRGEAGRSSARVAGRLLEDQDVSRSFAHVGAMPVVDGLQ